MTDSNPQRLRGAPDVKATLLGGYGPLPPRDLDSLQMTLSGAGPELEAAGPVSFDDVDEHDLATPYTATTTSRTTVLPRRAPGANSPFLQARPRYEHITTLALGEGGMGRVELARDNDIRRTVAVKRLHGGTESESALARFADEIRVVGLCARLFRAH